MQPRRTIRVERLAIVAIFIARLSVLALGQQAPDPAHRHPNMHAAFNVDPHFSGLEIGVMHRPHGRLRTVTWYQGQGFGGLGTDPPGWEKRKVFRFDDSGECREIEDWEMGFLAARRRACASPLSTIWWRFGSDASAWPTECWRSEALLDSNGHHIATIRTTLSPEGDEPSGAAQWVEAIYTYDATGRVSSATVLKIDGTASHFAEWYYLPSGRIARTYSAHRPRGPELTEDFEYDSQGRVCSRLARLEGEATIHAGAFEYDATGRVVRDCETLDGAPSRNSFVDWSSDGRLISRVTFDLLPDSMRNRAVPQWRNERFDGLDRPLSSTTYDMNGRRLHGTVWSYQNDSHGNWTHRRELADGPGLPPTVWREIEYAE